MADIVIATPYWDGHHPTHMVQFARALIAGGHRVVMLCPEPIRARHHLSQMIENNDSRRYVGGELPDAAQVTATDWLGNLPSAIARTQRRSDLSVQMCLLTHIDDLIRSLRSEAAFPSVGYPVAGLYLHPGARRFLGFRTRQLWRKLRKWEELRVLMTLDGSLVTSLSRQARKPVITLPEITDERTFGFETDLEREISRLANHRVVIGLFGSLERRKGLVQFTRLAGSLPSEMFFLVLIGKIVKSTLSDQERQEVSAFLLNPPVNALVREGYVEDERELNSAIRRCDLIYAIYPRFPSSSNMLTKAAVFEVPVVVAAGTVMAQRVLEYGLGYVVSASDPESLRHLLQGSDVRDFASSAAFRAGCTSYRTEHGMTRLMEALEVVIASSLST